MALILLVHESKVQGLLRCRPIRQDQLAAECAVLDNDGKSQTSAPPQARFRDGSNDYSVGVGLIVDQGISEVGGRAADPINAYVTAVERQSVGLENVVDLVEAPREKGLVRQRVGGWRAWISGKEGQAQGNHAFGWRTRIVDGQIGSIGDVLAQSADIGRTAQGG